MSMKTVICMLLVLLCGCSLAETAPATTAAPEIEVITPTPSAVPEGAVFSSEDLIVTLPYGMNLLDEDALAAYEAAVQSDYPGAARTILAATKPDGSAALHFAVAALETQAPAAAQEAAEKILGSSASVSEKQYGENPWALFSCAIGEQTYRMYFLSNGSQMLCVSASGLTEAEIAPMLTGLVF